MNMHPDLGYFDEGLDLVEPKLYRAAVRPFGRAETLPPAAFRSKIFADLEDEKVWTRNWICIGTQQEIPKAGDLLPFTIGHHGIHVERTKDGGLIGRFNKAQHGGCRVVPAQCQTGIKTKCSFTSCGYSRDRVAIDSSETGEGSQMGGQYLGDRPERLLPVKVDSLGPFIFVNLDPESKPLRAHFKGLAKPLGRAFDGDLRLVAQERREYDCNWKLAGRAFLESLTPPFGGGNPAKSAKPAGADKPAHTIQNFGLTAPQRKSARLCWLFPNLLLVLMPDHVLGVILQPTATTMTLERISLFVDENATEVEELTSTWMDTLDQCAAHGVARQQEINAATKPPRKENCASGYDFQKFLVACILAEHDYYWSVPLFAQPGR